MFSTMDEVLELDTWQVVRSTETAGTISAPDFTWLDLGRAYPDLSDDDMSAVRKFTAEDAVRNTNSWNQTHVFDSRFYEATVIPTEIPSTVTSGTATSATHTPPWATASPASIGTPICPKTSSTGRSMATESANVPC